MPQFDVGRSFQLEEWQGLNSVPFERLMVHECGPRYIQLMDCDDAGIYGYSLQ